MERMSRVEDDASILGAPIGTLSLLGSLSPFYMIDIPCHLLLHVAVQWPCSPLLIQLRMLVQRDNT
jgi:hypothetical protein